MKLLYTLINVIISVYCISLPAMAQKNVGSVKSIMIDPGHGGKDPGCVSGKIYEKDIVLSVALKLGKLINDKHPDVKILYTRKDDTFIPLQTRGEMANNAHVDFFVSIHVNATTNNTAKGTETYILGADKSGANLSVAMRENDVILYENDYTTRYEGYTPGSSESYIMFSLMNYAFQTQSLRLANFIQDEFATGLPLKNRGVKQEGYLVLRATAMPSILTEIGFMSNPDDRKYITSTQGQDKIANLLMTAIDSYIKTTKSSEIKSSENNPAVKLNQKEIGNDVYFRILAIKSKTRIPISSQNFGPFVSITEEIKDKESYNYYIEKLFSYKEALLLHQKIQDLIPEASIVAFRNTKTMALEDAKKVKP